MDYEVQVLPAKGELPNILLATVDHKTYFVHVVEGRLQYEAYAGARGRPLSPDKLQALPQLQAIGSFYKTWLMGGPDPIVGRFEVQQAQVKRWVETRKGPQQIWGKEVGFGGIDTGHPQVLKSAAGYYIGELAVDTNGRWAPWSRNSQYYWATREEATLALINANYEPKRHV